MKHKFAHVWTSFIFSFEEGKLLPNGFIDLRKMKDNGELDEGEHHHGGSVKIKGKATDDKELDLDTEKGDKYRGFLIFESDDGERLVIAGRQHLKDPFIVRGRPEFEQDDPPWVITKP